MLVVPEISSKKNVGQIKSVILRKHQKKKRKLRARSKFDDAFDI